MPNELPPAQELTNDSIVFDDHVLEAVKNFARSKPWKGDVSLRTAKFRELHDALFMGTGPTLIVDVDDVETHSGNSRYNVDTNCLELTGKLSVVTYLYLYFLAVDIEAYERGDYDGISPMVKAMTMFKLVFPKSYAKLQPGSRGYVSGSLNRDHNLPPVASPSQTQAVGTESTPQMLPPPMPQVQPNTTDLALDTESKVGPDSETGEI